MKKVRIKTWAELEKEFGVDNKNYIKCDGYFTPDMECNMPESRVIEVWEKPSGYFTWDLGYDYWSISEDMIAEYIEETPEISEPEVEQKVDIFKDDFFQINLKMLDTLPHKANHIHYLKWNLTSNLSVRYFYNFETKPELIGKFTLKNHKHKQIVEISEETAKEMIKSFCTEKFEEIIGYNQKGFGYKKYVKKFGEDFVILKNDNELK